MMTVLLSTILVAAPIPKANDEGRIAFIVDKRQTAELIVLSPSGKELRRVEFKDLGSKPYLVKLAPQGEFAIITSRNGRFIQLGNINAPSTNGYILKLDGKSKPELLVENKIGLKWVLNRDATQLIATEIDEEKLANLKAGEIATKAWTLDLKSKKQTPIPLTSPHTPIGITSDGSTLLTYTNTDGNYRTALTATSNWKTTFLSETSDMPYGISPDGTKVLLREYSAANANVARKAQLYIHDVKTKQRHPISMPAECHGTVGFSFGSDGKHLAMVCYVRESTPVGDQYSYLVYQCRIDGTDFKLLFESAVGEYISSVSWR